MGAIGIVLLITFAVISILLIGIVLIQSESGDGLGGLFGSGSSAAFGSRSQTVITKTTYVLVALFFATSFIVAFLNKTPSVGNLEAAARQVQSSQSGDNATYWVDKQDTAESVPEPAQVAPVQDGE